MFFPPNCPPEVLKKVIESQNKQRQINKISDEERAEIKKMNEYKKLMDEFHKNFNHSKGFSMSGMMYYGKILGEYHRLRNKYSDKENYDLL